DGLLPATGNLAPMLEAFRGTAHEGLLVETLAELNEDYYDESSIETLFSDTVDSLRKAQRAQEFEALHKKIASNTHTPEELLRYRELLKQKHSVTAVSAKQEL